MLVSIVTVLSRLPSLAATTEAKFSAPAESKAMVNLPVLIHLLPVCFSSHQSLPDVICPLWWCDVISATQMWFQAVHFDPVFAFRFPFIVFSCSQYLKFPLEISTQYFICLQHHYITIFVITPCFFLNVPYEFKTTVKWMLSLSCFLLTQITFLWFESLPFILSSSK